MYKTKTYTLSAGSVKEVSNQFAKVRSNYDCLDKENLQMFSLNELHHIYTIPFF